MESDFGQEAIVYHTVGYEEEQIRKYIHHQEQLDAKGYDETGEF